METLTETFDNDELQGLEAEIEIYLARNYLKDFSEYINPAFKNQWFHDIIDYKLQQVLEGKIKRLMVFMPPQHAKTTHVSHYFPSFSFGKKPDLKIISCSYSSDLSSKINRNVQRTIDNKRYRLLFPESKLNDKNIRDNSHGKFIRNSDEFEIVGHSGFFKSVGVGGPLSGNAADIIIIDDPIKDAVEAQSTTDRNRKWEWYCEVVSARLRNTTAIVLLMTRWNEDDLAGRILAHEPGVWDVISFPYIKEDNNNPNDPRQIGEALWPEMHSVEKAMQLKANSERMFASLCQQRPAPSEGGIFKRHYWKFWQTLPAHVDKVIFSWDCAFKDTNTSDYVVGLVLAKYRADTYIVDMFRGRWDFVETIKQMRRMHEMYPMATEKLIEEKANGAAVISVLRHEIPGLIPIVPTESKIARAQAVSSIIESGNVYLPEFAPWRDSALYELSIFPNGANDDIVDCLTQALNRLYVSPNQTARLLHMAGAR